MSKTYRYPRSEIRREYGRSIAGMTACLVPLLLLGPSSVIVYILGGVFCLFLLYGIRALERSRTRISISGQGIFSVGATKKTIIWEDLEGVTLNYFSSRRDGENGWMQLGLSGNGVRIKCESTLRGFEELTEICLSVARARGLTLAAPTRRNAEVLGVLSGGSDFSSVQNVEE